MSKVEVNQVSSQCGSTLTIGQSGDTVQLASGATQTGFGRTGTVDWDTTVKTAAFTAENGKGYFVNTTSAAITVTLPASPSAGNIVAVMDYANTAATNNITLGRNSSKIDGEDLDGTIKTNGQSFTLVYIDSTEGWKTVNNATAQIDTGLFVAATGGTITTCGDYKIHTFTSPGTFTVTCAGNSGGSTTLDYLVVAGGGGAGARNCNNGPAGGGAGGFRYSAATFTSPSCAPGHPLRSPTGITAAAQGYPITVGAGGAGATCSSPSGAPGSQGANSVFSTITSAGGGFGAKAGCGGCGSGDGGSGGGNPSNSDHTSTPSYVGAGNTPQLVHLKEIQVELLQQIMTDQVVVEQVLKHQTTHQDLVLQVVVEQVQEYQQLLDLMVNLVVHLDIMQVVEQVVQDKNQVHQYNQVVLEEVVMLPTQVQLEMELPIQAVVEEVVEVIQTLQELLCLVDQVDLV